MGDVEESVVAVVKKIRELNPEARLCYVGLYNPFKGSEFGGIVDIAVSEWQARLVRQFSDDANVTVVQTFDVFTHNDRLGADRFHPGVEGYAIIGRRIADAL